MKIHISKITELKENISQAIIFADITNLAPVKLNNNEKEYLTNKSDENTEITIFRYPCLLFFFKAKCKEGSNNIHEKARKAGAALFKTLKNEKISSIQFCGACNPLLKLFLLEGLLLASYSFNKYKKEKDSFELKEVFIHDENIKESSLEEITTLAEAVFFARDLINEPLSTLTAVKLSEKFQEAGKKAGFTVDVFGKQKISSLKMGGLLAVNKGSIDPPTFSVMEWKPEKPVNKKPVILVGKGIVYDTGGLSLKPTANSMDYMKSDMSGAAVVAATLYAISKLNIPVHVIGLAPATDNRPDGNAYAPGDIITMYDGTTVEVKNTDAEGRLVLADALSYSKKHAPSLVIDIATLTGSAMMITGNTGIVAMGNNNKAMSALRESGEEVYERVVELPLWDEFAEPLKSPVADLNNLGAREGQASIAGKFLEHFTSYPWLHLDIAGAAFINEEKAYNIKGGTGVGTRLLFNFLKKHYHRILEI